MLNYPVTDYLGHEFDQVIIDCREQLHVDAIAALSGTVVAGGQLQLLTGSTVAYAKAFAITLGGPDSTRATTTVITYTRAKQQLSQHLRDTETTHLLLADCGCGKSYATLAAVARQLQQYPQQRLLVTAPAKPMLRSYW